MDAKTAEKKLRKLYQEEKEKRLRIEQINRHLKLLEEVGDIFAEDQLNYHPSLAKVTKLLVKDISHICSFDILENDRLERVAQEVNISSEKKKVLQQIRKKYPDWFHNLDILQTVIKEGRSFVKNRLTKEEIKELTQDQKRFELIDTLEVRSYFILPLKVKNKVLGAITLVVLKDGRDFIDYDVSFLSELASKVALHLENSLMNRELESRIKKRTKELESANEELELFSYGVSHDLRTPLRAIGGYTSLLVEDYLDQLDEDGRTFLMTVYDEAQRMGELIDDLLAFSRLSRTEKVGQFFSMKSLIQQSIDEVLAITDMEPTIEIGDLADVHGDPKLLRQVWVNLLSNAVKYRKTNHIPRISIGSREDDQKNQVVYFIKDDGVGFDMKYADKLFGVFQRLHDDDEFEGTGIGLALTRRIINRHGGRIWAESELDKGSIFYFTLKN
ncbi:MAG: ATP-binding protein [Balneolaceae bacterium]